MNGRIVAILAGAAMLLGHAGMALAEDRAVIVAADPAPGFEAEAVAQRFRVAGFATTAAQGLRAIDLPRPLEALEGADPSGGARVVILAGNFVSAGGEVWLTGADAGRFGLSSADRAGIGVSRVITLIRDSRGPRIVMLAEGSGGATPGARLSKGVGPMTGVAGVSVVAGPASVVARASAQLAAPNGTLVATLAANPELRVVSGPVATGLVISRGAPSAQPGGAAPGGGLTNPALPGEAEAWVVAAARNDAGAYRGFLDAFPDGRYAGVARDRLARLGEVVPVPPGDTGPRTPDAATPANPAAGQTAALSEITLNLSLGERSQIQRILTGQGYDTGGSDGQFGRGTREALRQWQAAVGLPATGYVDNETLRRLRQSAGLR